MWLGVWLLSFESSPRLPLGTVSFYFRRTTPGHCRISLSLSLNFMPFDPTSSYEIKIPKSIFDCASPILKDFYWLFNCLIKSELRHLALEGLQGCDIVCVLSPKSLWSEPDMSPRCTVCPMLLRFLAFILFYDISPHYNGPFPSCWNPLNRSLTLRFTVVLLLTVTSRRDLSLLRNLFFQKNLP